MKERKYKKFGKREKIFIAGLLIAIAMGVGVYVYYSHYYPSTDDAYVNANIVYIAPQVSGEVDTVAVSDHQAVNAGDLLLTINQAPFIADLNQAKANLQVAQAELAADEDEVKVSAANLANAQAKLVLSTRQNSRTLNLLSQGYASQDEADQANANLKSAQAVVAADEAALIQAQQNIETQRNQIKAAEAELATAQLNLSYTTIKAPVAGIVSNLTLRPGMVVSANNNLFAIVDQNGFWVDTNFEETKLQRIRVGQSAAVTLDMYPGITFKGTVQSISAANGSTFSLLPPENATGNWVKVTQRFTVKVLIPPSDLTTKYPLRVGASAKVMIDTRV